MGEQQICFETFRLDLASERLWGEERPIHLRPKTFAVLRYLVERAGQLVPQEELLENVWSARPSLETWWCKDVFASYGRP